MGTLPGAVLTGPVAPAAQVVPAEHGVPEHEAAVSEPALEIDRLVIRYGSVLAVDEFSYSGASGGITALLGPNGAGKSSILGAISTAVPVHSGRVRIFGHDVAAQATAARAQLGLVFQDRTLDRDLSVWRNLWFHARLFGMGAAQARARIDVLLATFGLDSRRGDEVGDLSGGLARRVEMVRALLHRPRLLVLDEPTNGLDPEVRQQVWSDLRRMRAESGVSILFSTHYMDEAEYADDIVILDGGRLVSRGSAAELKLGLATARIVLRTHDDALAAANLTAAGWDAACGQDGLVVRCAEPERALAEVVAVVGTGVSELCVRHPTMNDVYLSATRAGTGEGRGQW
ncbi:MAG TPA: ABC transporter ATP-binding protein [Pseudonocardiaceae bacterium]|nr:ABC transporter ATP-binding protein [Pseudonocardiaceae bacterium]